MRAGSRQRPSQEFLRRLRSLPCRRSNQNVGSFDSTTLSSQAEQECSKNDPAESRDPVRASSRQRPSQEFLRRLGPPSHADEAIKRGLFRLHYSVIPSGAGVFEE